MHRSYKKQHSPHLSLAKKYWKEHLNHGDLAIDATCGNGHDTLFLSEILVSGIVYAFDIQNQAIQNTEALLQKNLLLDRVVLHQSSHAEWNESSFPMPPSLIVYNLGYLPKGDKQLTTTTKSTLESIQIGLRLLKNNGAMSITCYPGHVEGAHEEKTISEFLTKLPSNKWLICHHRFVNRVQSPSLFWIVKRLET